MEPTILDVHFALGTGMEAFFNTTLADLAPRSLFVFMTSRAFAHAVFPACSTVKTAGSNHFCICLYLLHKYIL